MLMNLLEGLPAFGAGIVVIEGDSLEIVSKQFFKHDSLKRLVCLD